MQRYAQLSGDTVSSVIESEFDPDGTNGEWIACGDAAPGWRYTDGIFSPPPPPAEAEWVWYIDHGPFTDRLGVAATMAIDTSSEPAFVAIRADFARRKWIDLRDPRVAATVGYLAGQQMPGLPTLTQPLLSAGQADAALNTPVVPEENLALRKLYFA